MLELCGSIDHAGLPGISSSGFQKEGLNNPPELENRDRTIENRADCIRPIDCHRLLRYYDTVYSMQSYAYNRMHGLVSRLVRRPGARLKFEEL